MIATSSTTLPAGFSNSTAGHGIPWEGNYSSWLEQKEARLRVEEAGEKARKRAMEHELEWVRSNPKGRQAKSKARLKQFEELSSPSYQARLETNEIYIPPGPRLGDVVLEVENLKKGFGDKLLIDGLSFQLPPGGIVGVIGPERRRQDDLDSDDYRAGAAGLRHVATRRNGAGCERGPIA